MTHSAALPRVKYLHLPVYTHCHSLISGSYHSVRTCRFPFLQNRFSKTAPCSPMFQYTASCSQVLKAARPCNGRLNHDRSEGFSSVLPSDESKVVHPVLKTQESGRARQKPAVLSRAAGM